MHLSALQWLSVAVCLITSAAQVGLLVVLSKKGLRKSFPVFFAYNAFYALMSLLLVALFLMPQGASSVTYFYVFWGLNAVLMLMEFGIMHEVFVHVVKPFSGLIDLTNMLFRWAAVFLVMAAVLTAVATTTSGSARCVAAIVYVGRGLRLMQCGMLLLFFFFERRLGLSWRSYAVSAAMGLSVSAAVGLTLTYFRVRYPAWGMHFTLMENGVYLGVVFTWLICFYLPQPARKNVLDSPARLIFQRWNEALMATPLVSSSSFALASNSQESFIPSVEKAVERVMARKMTH